MSRTKFTQCLLRRENTEQVSWIPSVFAVVGDTLQLKDYEKAIFEDGWKVISIGTELEEKFLPDSHEAIKNLWRATSGPAPIGHK